MMEDLYGDSYKTMTQAGIIVGAFGSSFAAGLLALRAGRLMDRIGTKYAGVYADRIGLALLVDSWLFMFLTVVHAATYSEETSCNFTFYTCAFSYAASKGLVYMFMNEKVHLATPFAKSRRDHKQYLINLGLLMPFGIILILMLLYGGSDLLPNGECWMYMLRPATIPLVTYDTLYTTYLTYQFLKLLHMALKSNTATGENAQQREENRRFKAVATRNLKGSVLSLISTCQNLLFVASAEHFTTVHCFMNCTLDVAVNCWVVHRMSTPGPLFGCSLKKRTRATIAPTQFGQNKRRSSAVGSGTGPTGTSVTTSTRQNSQSHSIVQNH